MIVATAGHIDHGKTALLHALTGHAGDRRREEQARGITIDLGYRYTDLGNETTLGFIDVPGHERFVHNMLAGAGGVDLALLVVAADDGVMPQTREHLAILALLGIPRLWVVVTKCDRADLQQQAAVAHQIKELLAAGPFKKASLFNLSNTTGDGVPELREALNAEAEQVASRADETHFRLSVDRAFSVSGAGVVVTGTALAGQVAVGDMLELADSEGGHQRVRVRGLHAQNQVAEVAHAGQRVALNLAGERLKAEDIHRGSWLLSPALLNPGKRLDMQLTVLADAARPLEHWTPVHVHIGAQRLTGRVALLEGARLPPGGEGLAQLVLDAHTHAVHGDRVVLRDQSAWHTLGGGRVLDPHAPARYRRTPERLSQLKALASGGLEEALTALLAVAENGLQPGVLERQFNRPQGGWRLPEGTLTKETTSGARLFARDVWQRHRQMLNDVLARFHEEQPDEPGPDRGRLRRYGLPYLEPAVFTALVSEALGEGVLEASGPWLHLPGHRVRLSAEEEALNARLQPHLEEGGINPPWVRDLASLEDIDEAKVRALLRKLSRLGQLHQVVHDLFYTEAAIETLAECAMGLAKEDNTLEVVAFRDALGLGRKRCIQILEYLDRIGVTRRFGNHRRVREESSVVQRIKTR